MDKIFKTKKRFGLNKVNHIQKVKRKSKDTAVVFDEKERHNFLSGCFNAKNKRKEYFEKNKQKQEKTEYIEKNRFKRQRKKEIIEKYKHIVGDKGVQDKFLQDFEKDQVKTKVEEMKNERNQAVIVKTSFLNI